MTLPYPVQKFPPCVRDSCTWFHIIIEPGTTVLTCFGGSCHSYYSILFYISAFPCCFLLPVVSFMIIANFLLLFVIHLYALDRRLKQRFVIFCSWNAFLNKGIKSVKFNITKWSVFPCFYQPLKDVFGKSLMSTVSSGVELIHVWNHVPEEQISCFLGVFTKFLYLGYPIKQRVTKSKIINEYPIKIVEWKSWLVIPNKYPIN